MNPQSYVPNHMSLQATPGAQQQNAPQALPQFGDRSSAPSPAVQPSMPPQREIAGYMSTPSMKMDPATIHAKEHTATRRHLVVISFSPMEAEATPSATTVVCGDDYAHMYRPGDSQHGDTRIGNPERALVFSARVMWVKNEFTFPVTVGSKALAYGNVYVTGESKRGLVSVPGTTCLQYGAEGLRVYYPTRNLYSKTVHAHGDLQSQHLDVPSVPDVDKHGNATRFYMVKIGSALAECLEKNQENKGFTIGPTNEFDIVRLPTGQLYTPEHLYAKARDALQKKVIQRLPYVDLRALDFYCFRPGGWNSTRYMSLMAGSNTHLCNRERESTGTVSMEIQLTYRLVGHGKIGTGQHH